MRLGTKKRILAVGQKVKRLVQKREFGGISVGFQKVEKSRDSVVILYTVIYYRYDFVQAIMILISAFFYI